MTDRAQFEAMLEALINEDQEAAKEIFHNIVVAKSREIYEELLAEDFSVQEEAEEEEEGVEEAFGEDEEGEEEESSDAEEEGEEEEGADDSEEEGDDIGGDATDDFIGDVEDDAGDEGGEGDGAIEDRVMDLEDALEELKAEFEQLMASEEGEGHHDDLGGDMGADLGGDMGDDMGAPAAGGEMDELERMMEYVNKVSPPKHGDNGVNTKSIVAGKNDMGGTAKNLAQSFSTTTGGTQGGLASPKAGDLTSGLGTIHNRKDSKAGKTAFTKKEPGHGAEKAGAKETADKSAGSVLNGAPKRAK